MTVYGTTRRVTTCHGIATCRSPAPQVALSRPPHPLWSWWRVREPPSQPGSSGSERLRLLSHTRCAAHLDTWDGQAIAAPACVLALCLSKFRRFFAEP